MTWRWSPAGGLLLAGTACVAVAVALVWRRRANAAAAPGSGEAVVEAGPLFWPHLIYTDAVIWTGTAILLLTLGRMSRLYRRQSAILFGAVFLPVVVNLLFNLDLGPFGRVDLTPFAFLTTAAVLVWAVLRFNLLDLRPVARSRSFQTIGDPVLVLDPFGRVIAAVAGQPLDRLLPGWASASTGGSGRRGPGNPEGVPRTIGAPAAPPVGPA